MGVSAAPHRMSVCSAPCDLLRGIRLGWRRRLEGGRWLGSVPVATNAQNKHHSAHKVTNEQHGTRGLECKHVTVCRGAGK